MRQEIKKIKIENLHLWTENPRDPMDPNFSDFDIIKKAVENEKTKWNLPKLLVEMGQHYDFSELPTVVNENNKYIIFDGNRRIAVLKYLQNKKIYQAFGGGMFIEIEPKELLNLKEIPCNICSKEIALDNIERKHMSNGSWGQLERDYFKYNFRKKEKSLFLKFEKATGLISRNPGLNENIMKNNILTESKLKEIGFSFDKEDNLISVYNEKEANNILNKIAELKINGTISSRGKDKYKIKKHLDEILEFKDIIKKFDKNDTKLVNYKKESVPIKNTRRQNNNKNKIFGEKISLKKGITNDIYRDIFDLYNYYEKNKSELSNTFPNLIRMALRLLVESATFENQDIAGYTNSNFLEAKKNLTQNQKTTLSNNSITKAQNLIQLLQAGAHDYANSANFEQTIAMSIIISAMLNITHFKNPKK